MGVILTVVSIALAASLTRVYQASCRNMLGGPILDLKSVSESGDYIGQVHENETTIRLSGGYVSPVCICGSGYGRLDIYIQVIIHDTGYIAIFWWHTLRSASQNQSYLNRFVPSLCCSSHFHSNGMLGHTAFPSSCSHKLPTGIDLCDTCS